MLLAGHCSPPLAIHAIALLGIVCYILAAAIGDRYSAN